MDAFREDVWPVDFEQYDIEKWDDSKLKTFILHLLTSRRHEQRSEAIVFHIGTLRNFILMSIREIRWKKANV